MKLAVHAKLHVTAPSVEGMGSGAACWSRAACHDCCMVSVAAQGFTLWSNSWQTTVNLCRAVEQLYEETRALEASGWSFDMQVMVLSCLAVQELGCSVTDVPASRNRPETGTGSFASAY